jgi:hypothetical protein
MRVYILSLLTCGILTCGIFYPMGSQHMVPGPAALTPTGNLVARQIPEPYPTPTESGTLELGPSNLHLIKHLGYYNAH